MKLGLILPGPVETPLPSTRVALLNVLPRLRQVGIADEILHAPESSCETPELQLDAAAIAARGINVVIFQKVHGASAEALARRLQAVGVRSVFLVCDRITPAMAEATDATVCVTQHLADLYPRQLAHKLHVVHDGIEQPGLCKAHWRDDRGSVLHPLRAVLVTSSRLDAIPVLGAPPPWLRVDIVGHYPPCESPLERLRAHWRAWQQRPARRAQQLRMVLHPRITLHAWEAQGVYDHLARADIGIIPIDRTPPQRPGEPAPDWSVKSENRLTLKMSMGLPVVATPIPSYAPVVRDAENGFLAATDSAWHAALTQLRSAAVRRAVGEQARADVADAFSQMRQAARLHAVLQLIQQGAS